MHKPIQIILGNPPYFGPVKKGNDINERMSYPNLKERIRETYGKYSKCDATKILGNSYIYAIRWASDFIDQDRGIVLFITGAALIDKVSTDGLRKSLREEFATLYIINLRGDIRKNMLSKNTSGEGGNIFENASQSGVAINILVKNAASQEQGKIFYYDIGDNLATHEKIEKLKSIQHLDDLAWERIQPNQYEDWINQRETLYEDLILLSSKDKKNKEACIFNNYSLGIKTGRDVWVINASKEKLTYNMQRMIKFYHQEMQRIRAGKAEKSVEKEGGTTDLQKIKWTPRLKSDLKKQKQHIFKENRLYQGVKKPFTKEWFYFDTAFVDAAGKMPEIFPFPGAKNLIICMTTKGSRAGNFSCLMANKLVDSHFIQDCQGFPLYLYEAPKENRLYQGAKNLIICMTSKGSRAGGFSCLITNKLVDRQFIQNCQCFPLYLYEAPKGNGKIDDLFLPKETNGGSAAWSRKDAIRDAALEEVQAFYREASIVKEDIFYYIYGFLHCQEFRRKFLYNLLKEMPRIKWVESLEDFWAFSKAGRSLADLHLYYEDLEPYPVEIFYKDGPFNRAEVPLEDYEVTKMEFNKRKDKTKDKTIIHYNQYITLKNIPLRAYDYCIDNCSAIGWVMAGQARFCDKDSLIVNDPNDWARETMNNPAYPLDLLLRIITMSLKTLDIIEQLPKIEF